MKAFLRLIAGIVGCGVVGLFLLPFLVAAVIAGQLQQASQQASQLAAQWDVPPEVVPALQDAGQRSGVPWFLLAAVASVATDFARHAPDAIARGVAPATAVFPVVIPAIGGRGSGEGMFLLDGPRVGDGLSDAQDVREAADWLAAQMASMAQVSTVAPGSGDDTPVDPGTNPIRQFGSAVLQNIAAPVNAANLDAFAAWAAGEGACARFNPLATTQPEPGATPFNDLSGGGHVWNYPTFAVGVQATTTALTNGLYRDVIVAFQASGGVAAVAAAVEHSPWGTQTFGDPSYDAHQCGASGVTAGPAPTPLPTVTGPDAVVATILARAALYQTIWSQMVAPSDTAATTTP